MLETAVSVIASFGVDGQKRVTADVNQTLGSASSNALRLNLLWQDSDVPGRDHVEDQRLGIAASLGLGLDTSTRAYVNLLYVSPDNIPTGYDPPTGRPAWDPPPGPYPPT